MEIMQTMMEVNIKFSTYTPVCLYSNLIKSLRAALHDDFVLTGAKCLQLQQLQL